MKEVEFRMQTRKILTLPNVLSLIRICLIPVYIYIYQNAVYSSQYLHAAFVLALSCLTDWADGWIARRFDMISTLGKILDPLADKLTQIAMFYSLSHHHQQFSPLLLLLIIKECFQLTACLISYINGKILPGALPAGKQCTAVLFASLITLTAFPNIPECVVWTIVWLDGILLLYALTAYIFIYFFRTNYFA